MENHAQRVATTTTMRKLDDALAGLHNGTFVHIREAARATGSTRSTISRRLNGGLSKHEAQHHRQYLSPEQEQALAKWVQHLASTGHPVHHSFLHKLAEEIHKPRGVDSLEIPIKLGKHWVS